LDRPNVMGDSHRRFPPPWTVEDKDTYFIVRDHNGRILRQEGDIPGQD
jgi:hypothetical protein